MHAAGGPCGLRLTLCPWASVRAGCIIVGMETALVVILLLIFWFLVLPRIPGVSRFT